MQAFQKIVLSKTNCFLLKAADGFLLIDCGCAGDKQTFLAKLSRIGVTPLSIRHLLLTHHHSDHCGLLSFLLSENPRLRIIMSETCADYMETGRHYCPAEEQYASKALGFVIQLYGLAGGRPTDTFPPYFRRACDVIVPNRGGDLPDSVGISGKLLHTPGHTRGSLSLIVREDAFVGDAARNLLQFLGADYEPVLYHDRKACFDSWDKILSTGVKRIHPAHGKSFPADRLKRRR